MIGSRRSRTELRRRAGERLWPVMGYVARGYRMTLARRPRVVAVVGSVGKTTTMRTVSAVLDRPVSRPALLNMNSHAAVGRALLGVRPWQRRAVLEVGIIAPGQMRRQAGTVRPNVVVVTAIAHDHWESFHSLEAIREEKAAMVRALPPSAVAVLNADDPNVRWMAGQTRAPVVLTGEDEDAEVRAMDVAIDWPGGTSFTVAIGERTWPVHTRLLGRHMVFPALAAIAVAHVEGRSIDDAVATLATLEPTPGRMQTLVLPSGAVVIRDEFKGTKDAWMAALAAFAEVPARRRFAVFGEISEVSGNQDYRDIGQRLALVDRAIFVATSKNFQLFRTGAVAGGLSRDKIERASSYREVLQLLQDDLGEGDVVLIRGRWQQALGRIALALAGQDVQCRADPCPYKRMLCDVCPMLNQPFTGFAAS